jgi:hypothetical protein
MGREAVCTEVLLVRIVGGLAACLDPDGPVGYAIRGRPDAGYIIPADIGFFRGPSHVLDLSHTEQGELSGDP